MNSKNKLNKRTLNSRLKLFISCKKYEKDLSEFRFLITVNVSRITSATFGIFLLTLSKPLTCIHDIIFINLCRD